MCGKKPKTPQVVQRDLMAEKRQAEAEAATEANTQTVARRRRRGSGGTAGAMVAQTQAMSGARQAIGANSLLVTSKPGG
jgi:hypothetical protein